MYHMTSDGVEESKATMNLSFSGAYEYDSRVIEYHPSLMYTSNCNHGVSKNTSKSAYIIALVNRMDFIRYGAIRLTNHSRMSPYEIYTVLRRYDGSPEHETEALVGIPIRYWNELLLTDSEFLQYLRSANELRHILDIHNLGVNYINDPLFRFRYAFKDIMSEYNPDDLILLNIEPRGVGGRLERSYPIPLLTIPGGRMEAIDNQSFERCGLREFREETGIDIENNHVRLCDEKIIKKKVRRYIPSSYQMYRHVDPPLSRSTGEGSVSMIYLVRITQPLDVASLQGEELNKVYSRPPGL
jgi:8-oxo-dGTP pyrophosphatase MutT (NUDIX family)